MRSASESSTRTGVERGRLVARRASSSVMVSCVNESRVQGTAMMEAE